MLYKIEDVSVGYGLNKNDIFVYFVWFGWYFMLFSGYYCVKWMDILKGVWLDEIWFKIGFCFCFIWIDFFVLCLIIMLE